LNHIRTKLKIGSPNFADIPKVWIWIQKEWALEEIKVGIDSAQLHKNSNVENRIWSQMMKLDSKKKRRPRKKSQTRIAKPCSTKAINITISATLSYGLACPSDENHYTSDLGWRSRRLTREEISDSDNLLFLQPSAIVAFFSDH